MTNSLAVSSRITHHASPQLLSSSGRIQEIDALRGFAIFLVTLHHAIIRFPIDLFDNAYCYAFMRWCTSVHMPLFFVIAGLCYLCRDYKQYIRKKFYHLAVPYIVFSLINMSIRYILPSLVNHQVTDITERIIKIMFYGEGLWFLYTLFIIFMIYPLLCRLISASKITMLLLLVVLFVLSVRGVSISLFSIGSVIHYLFFFHLGVTAKNLTGGTWPKLRVPAYALPIALCAWLIMLYGVQGFGVITALTGIIACFLMAYYKIFNEMFSRFGGYSLQLYLLNGIALGTSRAIICNILSIYNPLAIIVFNTFIDFLVLYLLIKYVLMKSKVLRFLMGA